MRTLRRPVQLYVLAVIASAIGLLVGAGLGMTGLGTDPILAVALLAVASVSQFQIVHLSTKIKFSAGDAAIFAAVLLVAAPVAMAIGGASTFLGLTVSTKQPLYNRLFNAAGTALAAGAATVAFHLVGRPTAELLADPLSIALAAAVYYLVKASLTDVVVGLQLRQNPLHNWWSLHRRDLPYHVALYLLGVIAAASALRDIWTLALFLVPIGLVLVTLRETTKLRRRTREAIIELADLIDQRDPYTYGHSQRVAEHARAVARRLHLPAERIELITEAARMHDIGKVSTPEHILKKPGPLDQREWSEMRRHCEAGHKFLQELPDFADGAELVLYHHERVDGSGYPRRLAGVDLPVEASIIAVCDAYDAMTSDRVYRPALAPQRVLSELRSGRGTQWHEKAVDALLELVTEGAVVPYTQRSAATAG